MDEVYEYSIYSIMYLWCIVGSWESGGGVWEDVAEVRRNIKGRE